MINAMNGKLLAWMGVVCYFGLAVGYVLWLPLLLNGVTFNSPSGLTSVEAMFAGLPLAIGVMMAGFAIQKNYRLSLLTGTTPLVTVALVRAASMAVNRQAGPEQLEHLACELLGAALVTVFLLRVRVR